MLRLKLVRIYTDLWKSFLSIRALGSRVERLQANTDSFLEWDYIFKRMLGKKKCEFGKDDRSDETEGEWVT